jgi:hypothetical protein
MPAAQGKPQSSCSAWICVVTTGNIPGPQRFSRKARLAVFSTGVKPGPDLYAFPDQERPHEMAQQGSETPDALLYFHTRKCTMESLRIGGLLTPPFRCGPLAEVDLLDATLTASCKHVSQHSRIPLA